MAVQTTGSRGAAVALGRVPHLLGDAGASERGMAGNDASSITGEVSGVNGGRDT
jgi:hypothetical protein